MARVCILLMDSMGIGASLDAHKYGDVGANTFMHIHMAAENGNAEIAGTRSGPLHLPNLTRLGLYHAAIASSGQSFVKLSELKSPDGYYGYAVEKSLGKDTPSGHWEIAGVPLDFEWGYFPTQENCFPEALIEEFIRETGIPGVLGKKHASGTDIILELGEEHIRTGKPIVYTSADSVFQIAVHEESFGLERLYEICNIARKLVDKFTVGRVIARPFTGKPGQFSRTGNRRDYSMPPPGKTLLDFMNEAGREVIAIGKIADIYAHQGPTQTIRAHGNMVLFDETIKAMKSAPDGSLVFTNFLDFDSSYGHRRDVPGYAHALELFDARLPELESVMESDDLLVITADHGCDPTFPGSDHTREHIPVLVSGKNLKSRFIGRRETFADIGQSIADYLNVNTLNYGVSFFS